MIWLYDNLKKQKRNRKNQAWGWMGSEIGMDVGGVKGMNEEWIWSKFIVGNSQRISKYFKSL